MYYSSEIPKAFQGIHEESSALNLEKDQALVFDLFHLEKNNGIGFWQRYQEKGWLAKAVRDAREVLLFSQLTQKNLESIYPSVIGKTRIIAPHLNEHVQPLDDDAKDIVRYKFAEGNAYFLFNGPLHSSSNLIELLKGFSIFKKKMGSNMKLLISGVTGKFSEKFLQSIETYKYRNDLVITGYLSEEERLELLAAAYALVLTNKWERFGMPVPLAMKAGVAVLAASNSAHSEMAGMAGMFFDEKDPVHIGDKLIRIYRDEQVKNEMIGTGATRVSSGFQ